MHSGVKRGSFGQHVCRIKMLTRFKDARHAALHPNLHLPTQNETPLRRAGAMELAAKTHRAGAQLITARRKNFRQHGLRRTLRQGHGLFAKPGAAIGVGKQNGFGESGHGCVAYYLDPLAAMHMHRCSPCCGTMHSMRILHTMLRVGNLQRSINFYTQVLGMKLNRTSENPEYKYSLAFLGYGSNPEHAEIELTYNWGVESYELGTAYGHIALGVPDAYAACDKIKASGGQVTREAGPVKGGSTVIAFVTDPDGYKIELIQRPDHADK